MLTRKRQAARLRPKVLHRLASELAAPGHPPFVLLHGAGSFGHPGRPVGISPGLPPTLPNGPIVFGERRSSARRCAGCTERSCRR